MATRLGLAALIVSLGMVGAACSPRGRPGADSTSMRPSIETVLRTHTDSLMQTAGVVGTAIGLCGGTPCIMVLVVRATPALRQAIPATLDGYRVELDETGVVRAQDRVRKP
jgi:hypothetical protein